MHFFRTGLDIRPTHGSVLKGMESVRRYNEEGLTGPGCWAHADMLAVGVTVPQPPGALHRRRKWLLSLGCVATPMALLRLLLRLLLLLLRLLAAARP